jgi:hypothetical protein
MSNDDDSSIRGDAAWKAVKQDVAKRNEAAFARGRQQRADRRAAELERQRNAERRELANLPTQPNR